MLIAELTSNPDFERVVRAHDKTSGLSAIVAIHNTRLGPALGGCRLWNYADEDAALTDALRLARGMTYKNALANLPFGGGKSVIMADPRAAKTPELMKAMGRFVQSLDGSYIVAEDVGTNPADMTVMREETPFVAGLEGSGSGDPSPATAWGVYCGLLASVRERLGRPNLKGLTVAIQGIGNVGGHLARHCADAGAILKVSDVDHARLRDAMHDFGATPVAADRIYDETADIFAPCALGAVIDDDTLPRLRATIVAGSANNQLAEDRHGAALRERQILYAPDYAINAGGVINIYYEYCGAYDQRAAFDHVAGIHDTLLSIYRQARRLNIPTSAAADRLAEDRFRPKAAA